MSAADLPPGLDSGPDRGLATVLPTSRAARPLRHVSTRFLRSELRLVFGRRRNQAGMGILALVPLMIAITVKLSKPRQGRGTDFFASITIFSLVATLWVSLVGAVTGLALFGGGEMTMLSGTQIGMGSAVLRVLMATVYLGLCFASLGAIGLFVSTLTEQPIGATIAVVVINVMSFILDSIPQLSWSHEWLPTHWWMSFGDFLRDPIAWGDVTRGLLTAAGYMLVFWLAAWARFSDKDVTG